MKKIININTDVGTLCDNDKNIINILKDLGFTKITNPILRKSIGKVVTLEKASKIQNIPLDRIIKKFEDEGYTIIGYKNESERINLIKSYLDRLNNNEDLKSVQADFIKDFSHVDGMEIAQAEQELINQGFNIKEVRKLCDVHSALFHQDLSNDDKNIVEMKDASLCFVSGHPLNILYLENQKISENIDDIEAAIDSNNSDLVFSELCKLKNITSHYKKKGELLYPFLANLSITGPSEVMWDVDDQIRSEIRRLIDVFDKNNYKSLVDDINALLLRIREMIFKEQKILYPMTQEKLTNEDWYAIYKDFPDYGYSYLTDIPIWNEYKVIENKKIKSSDSSNFSSALKFSFDKEAVIEFPSGTLTLAQLDGLLKTMPMEITFVDHNNINKYFSEHCPIFQRPLTALDRDVSTCHPPKAQYMMTKIIDMFKNKSKRSFHRMDTKGSRCILVRYYGVYDRNDEFIGVLELVEDFKDYYEDIQKTMSAIKE